MIEGEDVFVVVEYQAIVCWLWRRFERGASGGGVFVGVGICRTPFDYHFESRWSTSWIRWNYVKDEIAEPGLMSFLCP